MEQKRLPFSDVKSLHILIVISQNSWLRIIQLIITSCEQLRRESKDNIRKHGTLMLLSQS